MSSSPIVVIDDDVDDLELIEEAFSEINSEHKVITFDDGDQFFDYMKTSKVKPFVVLCDMNMGKTDGLSLKKKISEDEQLRLKCVPFLLFSTSKATKSIYEAYSHNVQGYFIKPVNLKKTKEMFQSIISYWTLSEHPAG
jgi:DNA-binding NtrC family response regulator